MIKRIFIKLGILPDKEEEERELKISEKLENEHLEYKESEARKKQIKIANDFIENLRHADKHCKSNKLMEKRNTDNIRVAYIMEEEEKRKQKNTKLFIS